MDKKELVKQKIGLAARACFLKYGLEKTTLDDIAQSIGLSKSSLFYYYKNKEALFLEVAIQEGEEFLLRLQAKIMQKKSLESKVVFYMQERYNYYIMVLSQNRISTQALSKLLPGYFELYDSLEKKEIQFVARLIKTSIKN